MSNIRVADGILCWPAGLRGPDKGSCALQVGTPLCVPSQGGVDIGRIASMELNHKPVDSARAGESVAMKIEATRPEEATRLYGRHFDHKVCRGSLLPLQPWPFVSAPAHALRGLICAGLACVLYGVVAKAVSQSADPPCHPDGMNQAVTWI